MKVGKKKYKLSYCFKKWGQSQFSKYNKINNRQCAFGIRGSMPKSNKCQNRFHPIKCGECWRASNIKLTQSIDWNTYIDHELKRNENDIC